MSNPVSQALDATASAVAGDPSLAQTAFAAEGELVGLTEVDIRIGERTVKVDQPETIGGTDRGPNPVQFALASLGSCVAHTYRFWSEKLNIPLNGLQVNVQGNLDIRGGAGSRGGRARGVPRRRGRRSHQRSGTGRAL